jgi:hypothetical protein
VAAQVYVSTAIFIGGMSVAKIFHQVGSNLNLSSRGLILHRMT